jgi:hypothetical protein
MPEHINLKKSKKPRRAGSPLRSDKLLHSKNHFFSRPIKSAVTNLPLTLLIPFVTQYLIFSTPYADIKSAATTFPRHSTNSPLLSHNTLTIPNTVD